MNKIIVDNQYFGEINYIKTLFKHSYIKIEACESYQKMSFRNRCMVAGSNGVVNLSVPLENGRNQKQLMKEVKISQTNNWQLQHWRTIESCYSRSPFFEFYRDSLYYFFETRFFYLLDMNLEIAGWLKKQLRFAGEISTTGDFLKTYPEGIVDMRGQFMPKKYLNDASISPRYVQVFEERIGFQPNLCILDLLFCCGPASKSLLEGSIIAC